MGASTSFRTAMLWLLTAIITLGSVIYQRATGPTYPIKGSVDIGEQRVNYRLLTSHETTGDAGMEIYAPDGSITGQIRWRRYKSHDDWAEEPLTRRGENLLVSIPRQPAAGKVMYEITLADSSGNNYELREEPIVIRFKGPVPPYILYPHILLMFIGMLMATRTGFEGIVKGDNLPRLTSLTLALLFLGGLILGPIVQKFAFDAFWTGWPFGNDLTDNKTLVAVVFWVVAFYKARYRGRGMHAWAVIAAVVTLLVYLIPHSTLGSEIDYTEMQSMP